MKNIFIILVLSLLVSCDIKTSDTFSVRMKYSSDLDSVCSFFKGPKILDEWKIELVEKKVGLEKEWKAIGNSLILSTENILGYKFLAKENVVHLTLCNTPSRSYPLILNMRYSLSSFTENPVSVNDKVGTLFHEFLHQLIEDHIPSTSPILAKYANEHGRVKDHIHLLALQKAVYLSLNLEPQLLSIVKMDSRLPNGYYKKAWEIVNTHDDYYKVIVSELAKP